MRPLLQLFVDRLGGRNRALIVAVGAGATLLILAVSRWAAGPAWVPALSGLPLESTAKVTEQLDAAGIKYRLERGGADVLVGAADLARARVALAQHGLPAGARPGLELFDQPSWGMTDFAQRVNYRRALEGELERTIGKMRGIEGAQVHLALPERAGFRDAGRPAEASVVLRPSAGQTPEPDVVRGIAHLVASSVDGIESGRVTIVDDAGRLLSEAEDAGGPVGLTSSQLRAQREVEHYLEAKAEDLVSQVVGRGNVRVQVAAAMNFDRVERTVQSVDPDRQAAASEQKSPRNSATSYENSRSLETFSGAVGGVRRLTVAVVVNEHRGASGDSAGGPVMNHGPTAEDLARIEVLVRNAVGVDASRGDLISVVSVPFSPGAVAASERGAPRRGDGGLAAALVSQGRPIVGAVALLLVFALAVVTVRALRAPGGAGAGAMIHHGPAAGRAVAGQSPAQRGLPAGPGARADASLVRERAIADVNANPELAARLVRAWMRGA